MKNKIIPNTKILVVGYNREVPLPKGEIYFPIQGGTALSKNKFSTHWAKDDTGENISEKNLFYSELTALHWTWKNYENLGNPENIGMCQYRRYFYPVNTDYKKKLSKLERFGFYAASKMFPGLIKRPAFFQNMDHVTTNELLRDSGKMIGGLQNVLRGGHTVLPYKFKMPHFTVQEYHAKCHNDKDLDIARKVVQQKYPEYIPTLEKVWNGKKFITNNLFIMKKEFFMEYCQWIFDILFSIEKELEPGENQYQLSKGGFLAERLFTVWTEKNKDKLNIKRIKHAFIEDI